MDDWMKDLKWSNKLFLSVVWDKIKDRCGGGNIRPVEIIEDNEIAKELDLLCGIDIWQTIGGMGARGIASRVQNNTKEKFRGRSNWRTFTIRYKRHTGAKTEYEKRMEAIETGRFIYPFLMCQAYFDFGNFLGCGVARTVDIFDAIDMGNKNKSDNEFLVVPFDQVSGIAEFTHEDKQVEMQL